METAGKKWWVVGVFAVFLLGMLFYVVTTLQPGNVGKAVQPPVRAAYAFNGYDQEFLGTVTAAGDYAIRLTLNKQPLQAFFTYRSDREVVFEVQQDLIGGDVVGAPTPNVYGYGLDYSYFYPQLDSACSSYPCEVLLVVHPRDPRLTDAYDFAYNISLDALECGTVINDSFRQNWFTLKQDLTCGVSDGFVIKKNNFIFDGNQRTIQTNAPRNLGIAGIRLDHVTGVQVRHASVTGTFHYGIFANESNATTIEDNALVMIPTGYRQDPVAGITFNGMGISNQIKNNLVLGGDAGLLVGSCVSHPCFSSNLVSGNTFVGVSNNPDLRTRMPELTQFVAPQYLQDVGMDFAYDAAHHPSFSSTNRIENNIVYGWSTGILFGLNASRNMVTSNLACMDTLDVSEEYPRGDNNGTENTCDTANQWADERTTSGCRKNCIGLVLQPDLMITSVAPDHQPISGQPFAVQVTVKNSGLGFAMGNPPVTLKDGNAYTQTLGLSSYLLKDQETVLSFNGLNYPSGLVPFHAQVNIGQGTTIEESNLNNNFYDQQVTVVDSKYLDLALDSLRIAPVDPFVNEEITINATLWNRGGVAYQGPITLLVDFGDGTTTTELLPLVQLAPGERRNVHVLTHYYTNAGSYPLGMIVDPTNKIPESDETNNVAVPLAVVVQAAPAGAMCGNDILEKGEQCDGSDPSGPCSWGEYWLVNSRGQTERGSVQKLFGKFKQLDAYTETTDGSVAYAAEGSTVWIRKNNVWNSYSLAQFSKGNFVRIDAMEMFDVLGDLMGSSAPVLPGKSPNLFVVGTDAHTGEKEIYLAFGLPVINDYVWVKWMNIRDFAIKFNIISGNYLLQDIDDIARINWDPSDPEEELVIVDNDHVWVTNRVLFLLNQWKMVNTSQGLNPADPMVQDLTHIDAIGRYGSGYIMSQSKCQLNCTCALSYQCGQTYTNNVDLPHDLFCNGNGITMSGKDLTLDCHGFSIVGANTGTGIRVVSGEKVTVKNCYVSSFDQGIVVYPGQNISLLGNSVTSSNSGIVVGTSSQPTRNIQVLYNSLSGNKAGLLLTNVLTGTLGNNILQDQEQALSISNASDLSIHDQYINRSSVGLLLENVQRSTLTDNKVCESLDADIRVLTSTALSGSYNSCDKPDGWHDDSGQGCSYACHASVSSLCVDTDKDGYYAISTRCTLGNDCKDNTSNDARDCPQTVAGCSERFSTCSICINPGAHEAGNISCNDGVDNNCNSKTDNADAGCGGLNPAGAVCGNGVTEGSESCDDGNILNGDGCSSSCSRENGDRDHRGGDSSWGRPRNTTQPSQNCTAEICDGKDNDCNGFVDDNLIAPLCPKQTGLCKGAVMRCGGSFGWLPCSTLTYGRDYQDVETSCDGIDNNCDGTLDEGCKKPIAGCIPSPEICGNGKDEDCDGFDRPCPQGEQPSANPDFDYDGLTNAQEASLGTNPYAADSDGDRWNDKAEVDAGTDPLNRFDFPSAGKYCSWLQIAFLIIIGLGILYFAYQLIRSFTLVDLVFLILTLVFAFGVIFAEKLIPSLGKYCIPFYGGSIVLGLLVVCFFAIFVHLALDEKQRKKEEIGRENSLKQSMEQSTQELRDLLQQRASVQQPAAAMTELPSVYDSQPADASSSSSRTWKPLPKKVMNKGDKKAIGSLRTLSGKSASSDEPEDFDKIDELYQERKKNK
ncbi:hypothetical protein HZB02_03685 [Candidatus Woesearchaeota archaeon]|nr:hypothetical protein [Candidatus Woesearchaeota archaeon]